MTSARDEILGQVRAALAGTAPAQRPAIPHGSAPDDVVALFAERVADYRAVVERCTERQLPARLTAALPEGRVVVPAGLSVHVPDAVVDAGLTAAGSTRAPPSSPTRRSASPRPAPSSSTAGPRWQAGCT